MFRRLRKYTERTAPPSFPTGNAQPSYLWSIRLYVQEVFLRFRNILGIALLLLGYVTDLATGFRVPPLIFGILFGCAFVAANFLLFHRLRAVTLYESLRLPQWAYGSLSASGGGSHVTVIHYGFPARQPLDPSHNLAIRKQFAEHFGIPESQIAATSRAAGIGYEGGLSLGYPIGMFNEVLMVYLGVDHSGGIRLKIRTLADPLKIEWVIGALDVCLSFALSPIYGLVIDPSKRRQCLLSLSDWPGPLDGSVVPNATLFSQPHLKGFRNNRDYRLTKKTDQWHLAIEFAKVLLTDSGYVGVEAGLAELSRESCALAFKEQFPLDVADRSGSSKSPN